jgi:DtxR family Mn-dependent transcriptional regulator
MTTPAEKPITMVMEDYLEAIYELGLEKKVVRVRDIAARLDVKMPTVTSMLKSLSQRKLVDYEKYEYVELTPKGRAVGVEMHRRHETLRRFLTDILKIDRQTADNEACKLEHALSASTLDRLISFMSFIYECPRAGETWLDRFDEYHEHGHLSDECKERMEDFRCEFSKQIDEKKKEKKDS